jgi:hypothetical protein
MDLLNPAGAYDGEVRAAGLGCELLIGESRRMCLLPDLGLEGLDVVEAKDLTAAEEVDYLACSAVDGIHTDEVGFFVDADAVEAVVGVGMHWVEGVVGVAERPAFVVGEDGGDVVELIGWDVRTRLFRWNGECEERECGSQ